MDIPSFIHDEESFAREYSRLVVRLIRPYFLGGGEYEDLYQEGMIGLLQAIRTYNPERSGSFEAFAAMCIRRRLIDAVRRGAGYTKKQQLLMDALHLRSRFFTKANFLDPEAEVLANESAKEIQTALTGLLSAFEASVLGPYLEGYTVTEIAGIINRPAKSVDNAIRRVRQKLAQYLLGR